MSDKEQYNIHFGLCFETSKYEHISLNNFLIRTYTVSTAWFSDLIAYFYYKRNNGECRLLEYAKKCIEYIDQKYNPSVNKCSNRICRIYYGMKKLIENIASGNYLPLEDEIHFDHFDLEYNILGKRYSDKYFESRDEELKRNYELNMLHFKNLNKDSFNKELDHFLFQHPHFREIKDLNDADFKGIYILVLDGFKQMYIGCSCCIRYRIFQHFCRTIDYDRRIFGTPENSKISIDSFGYKDITRIYALELDCDLDELKQYEKNYIEEISDKYLANRISGGDLSIFTLHKYL